MAVHLLSDLTWTEVAGLDRERLAAILPVGAVEAHGPHLPIGTDCIIALAMAQAGARRLAEAGWEALVLPPLVYTTAPFAAAFPGTVSASPDAVATLVEDAARAAAGWGARVFALANAHLDPAHREALGRAVAAIRGEGRLPVAFPDVTRNPWALRLSEEFRSGACHAGRYEGSIVLAARPELVREPVRLGLAPNPRSLSAAIREGKASFEEAGGPRAYFGWPAEATAEEGRQTIETLGEILAEAVLAALDGRPATA